MRGRWIVMVAVIVVAGLLGSGTAAEQGRRTCSSGAELTLNLVDAELSKVLTFATEATGRRFIVRSDLPSTRITIFSPRPVCPTEAFEAILSALAGEGLTVVERGRFYVVLPVDEAVRSPIPVVVDP